jgi:hypothetical protein
MSALLSKPLNIVIKPIDNNLLGFIFPYWASE